MIWFLLLSMVVKPVLGVSTLQFFNDKNCGTLLGEVNGTTDGNCHKALDGGVGTRLVSLDPECAATIYTDVSCTGNATVAGLNICMSSDAVVGSFSIDCKTSNTAAAFTTAHGPAQPTATAGSNTPDRSKQADAQDPPNNSIPPAMIALIVGLSVLAIVIVLVAYFSWRCIRKHRQQRFTRSSGTNSFSHLLSPIPCLSPISEPHVSYNREIVAPSPSLARESTSKHGGLRGNPTTEGIALKSRGVTQGGPRKGTLRKNKLPVRRDLRHIGPPTNITTDRLTMFNGSSRNSTPAAAVLQMATIRSDTDRKTMHRRTIPQAGPATPSEPFMGLTGRSKEVPMMLDTSSSNADRFSLVSPLSPETYMPWTRKSFKRRLPPTPPSAERRPSSEALPPWQQSRLSPSTSDQTSYAELGGTRSSREFRARQNFI